MTAMRDGSASNLSLAFHPGITPQILVPVPTAELSLIDRQICSA